MNEKRQAFYKSRQWENLIKLLRIERASDDGFVICEHCGKPILKAYVDDATVALNPENIKLVHFRCHNEIHRRFGYGNQARIIQQVYLVYGSPCAGKTTWVDSVAEPEDIIMDIDRLWSAVRSGSCGQYEKPSELKSNVFAMRDSLLDMIRVRRGKWHNAYVIGGYPLRGERERLADSLNARIIFIDTPKEICLERAKQKNSDWTDFVENWFDRYSPPLP